jgi:hypothetical protein
MEALLRALIVGNAGMIALVAPSSVVWSHLPQTTPRPAIVLYRISGAPGLHMQGSDNLLNATVQIDIQATTVASMWEIRDELVDLLHAHSDDSLRLISMNSERQSSELLGTNTLIHKCSMDFDVWARA